MPVQIQADNLFSNCRTVGVTFCSKSGAIKYASVERNIRAFVYVYITGSKSWNTGFLFRQLERKIDLVLIIERGIFSFQLFPKIGRK